MTDLEETLMREIAALPKSHRTDVLAFVRYLRASLMDDAEVEHRYDVAIEKIHELAQQGQVTEKDIEEEIRMVRDAHARGA